MDAVISRLQPPRQLHDPEDDTHDANSAAWGSMAGYGNLDRLAGVGAMDMPRVADVSFPQLNRVRS